MKILLKISYLGTPYAGFQVQNNAPTVQSTLQDGVERVFGARYAVTGCSRTDSGVHADAFYCTVDAEGYGGTLLQTPERIPDAMNAVLPDSIAVLEAREVPADFHPRYSVISKEYRYLIHNSRAKDPFLTERAYHYKRPLDVALMQQAADHMVGEHDFAAFMASGSKVVDTVRCIHACQVERDGDRVTVCISANGFRYNMVRIIVGTLIAVSERKLAPQDIPAVIESRDRSRAGSTAPAHGLYLHSVAYPAAAFEFEQQRKEDPDGQ